MVEIVCNQQGENGFKLSSSLRSKRFQSSYSAKVRAGAKKKMEGGGGVEKRKPHSFRFFSLSSQLARRTRAETLAVQAS